MDNAKKDVIEIHRTSYEQGIPAVSLRCRFPSSVVSTTTKTSQAPGFVLLVVWVFVHNILYTSEVIMEVDGMAMQGLLDDHLPQENNVFPLHLPNRPKCASDLPGRHRSRGLPPEVRASRPRAPCLP